ncbi:MAG: hypothetical protein ACYTFQ_16715 [Planctomycetota bacterium]|jgi:hypothetical protein
MTFVDYPGHLVAGALLAGFAMVVLLAFRLGEMRSPKLRRYRLPLILLHYASILIVLLILWNPSRAKVSQTQSKSFVLAIFDTSESMSVVEDGESTRLDKALGVFEEKFRPPDDSGTAYRIFGFDEHCYHSGSSDSLRLWGSRTDMHGVFAAMNRYDTEEEPVADSNVTGAVIFTDGRADNRNVNAYLSLGNKDFHTVFVGVGSRDAQTDIAVTLFSAPARVPVETAFNMDVTVAARNLPDRLVTVELLRDGRPVDSRQVPADRFAGEDVNVEFTVGADRLGSYAFSARVVALDDEVNRANNVRSTVIEVVEETRLKVLFYSQVANFNVGKVRQALAGDDRIDLDLSMDVIKKAALAEKASKMPGHVKLPNNRRGFREYDIIVLGPCDLQALTKVQIDSLYSFVVERGGGLMLLPGNTDLGPAVWTDRKARALVPVVFDPDEPTIWPANQGRIELTLEGIDSRLLDPNALNDYDEPALPYYRITGSKPAATTLLEIEDTPVVSIHRVGRGRVCLLNAAKLYRWYREDLRGGLLGKVIAGLTARMGKITSRQAGIELFAERDTGQMGKVKFEAYVCDDSFEPVGGANVLLALADEVVSMNDTGRGYYAAEIENLRDQAVVATAQAEADGVFLGEKTIAVNLPPVRTEMTDIDLDEEFLRALAKKINGNYLHDESIVKMFETRAGTVGSRQMTSIWPNWLLLAILCALLSANWFARRSIGLV